MKSNIKKIVIGVTSTVLVVAIALGVWYYAANSGGAPISVYEFDYIGMNEYWGDSRESYGPVTTDGIQTIFLSDTQTVTDIAVSEGDAVKKGDLMLSFDTTLSDLTLERARLEVEKLKLQLENAKKELKNINAMRPMVIPSDTPDDGEENLGTQLKSDFLISTQSKYDGSSEELALICWIRDDKNIDDALLETIRLQAERFVRQNAEKEPVLSASAPAIRLDDPTGEVTIPTESQPEVTEPEATEPETTEPEITEPEATEPEATEPEPTEPEATEPEPTEPEDVNSFYVVFKVTSGNMSLGTTTTWQGFYVIRDPDTHTFTFRFFDASALDDYTIADDSRDDIPQIDFGSGYTAAQIAELRAAQEKTIRDLEFDIKMAEADYKIKQTEMGDGNIYAEMDGTVVSLLTEEEAKQMQQPILKVSSGGGFYVEGSVSELEREQLEIGQEVTITDWNTGMIYTGAIVSVGDFPKSDSGFYDGNPNASSYPFSVFIDESADLRAGSYVSVSYSLATAQQGIYLENPFIRTEQGRSYVYVRGEDGLLEKRYVRTGKSLWGSYIEIVDGITEEDCIAFPYGKGVKEGAQTQQGEISDLYNY